jgi:hypothetical protein
MEEKFKKKINEMIKYKVNKFIENEDKWSVF